MIVLYVVLAIVILLFMVLIHEFGHYVVGRMLNFKITEFSVGFGKALISRKNKRGELISLRLFPLGGYCAFAGEDETNVHAKDAFTNQKPWKRILVFLAGVTFNFAAAIIFSLILLCTVGYDIPKVDSVAFDSTSITHVSSDSNNLTNFDTANTLEPGDVIISINGEKIDFAYGKNYNELISAQLSKLKTYISSSKERDGDAFDEESAFLNFDNFNAIVRRNGEYKNVELGFYQVKIDEYDNDNNPTGETFYRYYFNVNASAYVHSFVEGLERAVPFSFGMGWVVLKSLWLLITFQLPITAIGGPITTITTIATYTQQNMENLLILLPLISANLAIFNLLPIPALDGAHVLFTSIEAVRKKPIKREVENMIHTIGLLVLLGAVIIIDILHFVL